MLLLLIFSGRTGSSSVVQLDSPATAPIANKPAPTGAATPVKHNAPPTTTAVPASRAPALFFANSFALSQNPFSSSFLSPFGASFTETSCPSELTAKWLPVSPSCFKKYDSFNLVPSAAKYSNVCLPLASLYTLTFLPDFNV